MSRSLLLSLRPVRRRLRVARMLRGAGKGVMLGGIGLLACVLAGWAWSGQRPGLGWGLLLPGAAALGGAAAEGLRRLDWLEVARRVDQRYGLKDAIASAWQFSQLETPDAWMLLQMRQAEPLLKRVVSRDVVAWRLPRMAVYGVLVWSAASLLVLWPQWVPPVEARQDRADAPAPQANAAVAEQLEKNLVEELERVAEMTGMPAPEVKRLRQLTQSLRTKTQEIKDPRQSTRQALQKLSEMQAELAAARDQLDPSQVDQQLQGVARAMSASEELAPVAESLQHKDFQQAAQELAAADPRVRDPEKAQQLEEELEQAEKTLREQGNDALADAVESLKDATQEADADTAKQLAVPLAQQLQQQALRAQLAQQLASQVEMMSEAKAMSRDGGKNTARSDQDRETFGQGDAGKPEGEATQPLATVRQREELTGQQGTGPSQTQRVEQSVDEPEQARRPVQPPPADYERMAEEVLRKESLPLSHRQTIRNYFRSIRPSGE